MSAFSIASVTSESETMADNETSSNADPFSTTSSPRWVRIPLTSSLPSFEDDSELLGEDGDPEQDEEDGENPFGDDIKRYYQPIPEPDVNEDVGLDTSEYSEMSATQSLDAERDSGLRTRGRCQGWTHETRTSVRTWTESSSRILSSGPESSSRILSSGPAQQQFMAGVRLPPRMQHDMSAGQAYGMPAHPMSPTDTSMHRQTAQHVEMGGDMRRPPQGMQHPQHHQHPPEMISPQHSMHTRMPHQFMLPSYSGMSEMSQISHGMPQSMVPSRHRVLQLPYGVQTPPHGMQTSPHGMQQAPPYAMQQAPPYLLQQTSPHVMQTPPMMSPHHPLMQSGPLSIYPQASVSAGSGGPLASLANFHPSGHHGINTNMGSPVPGSLHQQPPVFLLTMGPDNCLRMISSSDVPHMAPCLMMVTSSNDHPHMTPRLMMMTSSNDHPHMTPRLRMMTSSNDHPHMTPYYRHMVMRGITPPGSQPSPQMSPQMSHYMSPQMSAVMQTQTLRQMDTINDKSFINSLLVSGSLGVPGDATMMMEGQPKAQRLYGPGMLHGDPGSFMPLHQQYHMQATRDSGSVVSTPRLTSPMSDTAVSVSGHIKLEPSKDSASADGSVSHDDLVLDLKADQNELLKHPLGTGNGGWQFPTPDENQLKEKQLKENQLKENQLKENQLKENLLKENLLKELQAQAETFHQQLHNMPPAPLQEPIIDTSQSSLPLMGEQSLTGVSTLQGVFCNAYVDGVEDMYGSLLFLQPAAGLQLTVPSNEELAQRQMSNDNKLKLVPDLEACLPSLAGKALDEDDHDDMRNYNKQGIIQQSHIQENTPAARRGQLHLEDRIWTVNEVDSSNMHHCKSSHRRGSDDTGEMYQVELSRGSRGFGFSIRGGREFNSMPLFVLRIAEEGKADLDGRLRVGDQILKVNGLSTDNMTHTEAIKIIQNGGPSLKLLMLRTNKPPPPVLDTPPTSPRKLVLPSFQMLTNSLISHRSPHLARQQQQQYQQPLSPPPPDLQPASNDNFQQLPTTSHADTTATEAEVNNY